MQVTKEIIEQVIQDGMIVQLATWPSPLTPLKNAEKSKGQPEFCRTLEKEWLYYNSEVAQAKVHYHKMAATIEQQRTALLAMDWLTLAARRYKPGRPKGAIRAIVGLRCLHRDDASYGWRKISKALRDMGVSMSHLTVMRRYDLAIEDLMYMLKHVK